MRLESLDGLFFEPDGSFLWRVNVDSGKGHPRDCSQVDGMLYDACGQLQYIQLTGKASLSMWRGVVQQIDSNLLQNGVVMDIQTTQLKNVPTFEQITWGGISED